ncbi:hypothetical protein B0H10DRAFT_2033832 [Mycena sp. CBHHK59/15]|nr:hypothetical protein B0H10DRAFT_2033832 [Mycena sp. CBHHK59/15]
MHLSSLLSLSCLLLSCGLIYFLVSGHPRFALTINGGPHGSFTVELECTISSQLPVDISLGLDWKTNPSSSSLGVFFILAHISPLSF